LGTVSAFLRCFPKLRNEFCRQASPSRVRDVYGVVRRLVGSRASAILLGSAYPLLPVSFGVGIELRRASGRRRVTSLTLSVARWDPISPMTAFSEAPL
jgi:hypothetical protein